MRAPEGSPHYWQAALDHLRKDALLAEVMRRHDGGFLKSRGEALTTLLRAIAGQQISVKAADSVWARFVDRLGGAVEAERVLALSDEDLRACGFSGSKVRYVRGIAQGFLDGTVHPGLWDGMSDEDVIAELVKLPGIGRWTAEMFLMFHLLRPDVLPVADLGLVNGFKRVYGGAWKRDGDLKVWQKRMTRHAKAWAPYRSVAVWFLWRSLDPVEVAY